MFTKIKVEKYEVSQSLSSVYSPHDAVWGDKDELT